MNVAIITSSTHVQKSLKLLIHSDASMNFIEKIERSIKTTILLDVEVENFVELLKHHSRYHKIVLFSGSKEFPDINRLLQKYHARFFNVYTEPDCILNIIKENA